MDSGLRSIVFMHLTGNLDLVKLIEAQSLGIAFVCERDSICYFVCRLLYIYSNKIGYLYI